MKIDKIKEAGQEAKELGNLIIEKYNLNPIKIRVKEIRQGFAHYDNRAISIPIWAYNEGLNYFYAYVLHELSHFINYDINNKTGHSEIFKEIEKDLLKEFGLIPIYKRVYIKALKNDRGDFIWIKKGYEND